MKKVLSLILALTMCLSLCACGASGGESQGGSVLPKNVTMYSPMQTMETSFGEITILDAAFCSKAQIYYTKSSRTSKTTINGETTESYTEYIHPGYITGNESMLVFALRTIITNTSDSDITLSQLTAKASFVKDSPVYFSKGGNFQISDESYRTLAAGASSEFILAAVVPVEQYMASTSCLLEIDGAQLGFDYNSINVYNILGYQEGDNTPVSIDDVLQLAVAVASPAAAETAGEDPSEPAETEPQIETTPGVYAKDGSSDIAEGRAATIRNVSIGFSDTLPDVITSSSSYSHNAEDYAINESQIYAVIQFNITNKTQEDMKIVDIKDNFMLQLNYNNGYLYSTNSETSSFLIMGTKYGRISKNSSSGNSSGMSVAPLSSADVTAYIPCAREVSTSPDKPLTVTFLTKYSGNESFEFTFPNRAGAAESAPAASATTFAAAPASSEKKLYYEVYNELTDGSVEVHGCTMEKLESGYTNFCLEYTATAGLIVLVHGITENDTVELVKDSPTTGAKETFVFSFPTSDLEKFYYIEIVFLAEDRESSSLVYVDCASPLAQITDGIPAGAERNPKYSTEGAITVHSLTSQALDNGYIRFTLDCTAPEGRTIYFFNPPDADIFGYMMQSLTTGGRETIVFDISQEEADATSTITLNFYSYESESVWVFIDAPF